MPTPRDRERAMAAVVAIFFVLEGLAVAILAAAFGFAVAAVGRFGSLMDRGTDAADLLRVAQAAHIGVLSSSVGVGLVTRSAAASSSICASQ